MDTRTPDPESAADDPTEYDEGFVPGGIAWDETLAFPFLADFECSACGQIGRHDDGCPNDYFTEAPIMATATTKQCKIEGCDKPAMQAFGKYAGLCLVHRDDRRRENAENGHASTKAEAREALTDAPVEPVSADPGLNGQDVIADLGTRLPGTLVVTPIAADALGLPLHMPAVEDYDTPLLALARKVERLHGEFHDAVHDLRAALRALTDGTAR